MNKPLLHTFFGVLLAAQANAFFEAGDYIRFAGEALYVRPMTPHIIAGHDTMGTHQRLADVEQDHDWGTRLSADYLARTTHRIFTSPGHT